MATITRKLNPPQLDFVRSADRAVLLYGGRGGGKTRAICERALSRVAGRPGACEALIRKTYTRLRDTTLRELLEGTGSLGPVLPHGGYTHNKIDHVIRVHGGGTIIYYGLDDQTRSLSHNLTGAGIEEMVELVERDFIMTDGAIRISIPGLKPSIYGACNPGPPTHWIARRWGLAGGHKPMPGYRAFFSRPEDNRANLAEGYIESALDTLTGVFYRRFRLGQWAGADGLVFDNWNPEIHWMDVPPPPGGWRRKVLAIDEGFTHPFVCLSVCADGDGRLHIEREHHKSKMVRDEKMQAVRSMFDGHEAVVVDPSAADLIEHLRREGFPVIPANNAVKPGCHRVRAMLAVSGDGRPRLTLSPNCPLTRNDWESYVYREGSDEVRKENDDGADAARYGVCYFDAPEPIGYRVSGEYDAVPETIDLNYVSQSAEERMWQ